MIYTVEKAELLSEQLRKFTTGYAHQLAGQFANLEFWLREVESALTAIDEHNERFEKLKDGQQEWVDEHNTRVHTEKYCGLCGGICEFSDGKPKRPAPARLKSSTEKAASRRKLVDTTYTLLTRYYRMRLLSQDDLKANCDRIGTSIDPGDLGPSRDT